MKAETSKGGYGWMPPFGTPIYFEGEELPGGAGPLPDASPAEPAGTAPVDAPAGEAPIDDGTPPPPPWEGKTPEELWNRNGELIKENTSYKERYRPWEQVTEGLDPEDVTFYREFLGAIKSGDQEALRTMGATMREVLDRLSPAEQAKALDQLEAAQEEFDPFDRAQVEKLAEQKALALIEAREKEARERQAVEDATRQMNDHLAGLAKSDDDGGVGIPELADPTSPEYATVLWMAERTPELKAIGDPMERLTKAAQQYRDRLDERAQALLKAKSAADVVPATPQAGNAPSGSKTPTTMEEARRSAAARIEKLALGSEQSVGT